MEIKPSSGSGSERLEHLLYMELSAFHPHTLSV